MSGAPHDMKHASKRPRLSLLHHDELFQTPRTSLLFPALNPITNHDDATVLSQQNLMAAYIDTIEGLTEEEKARHALHLAEAVEKMRRRGAKSETSQVQAQTAATQPKTRFWGADSPAADLPKHLLWSRKYQPSDLSEVLGNGSVCQQLQDWLASWQRSTAQASAVQPLEQQQTHESELSPQSWRGSPRDGNWSEDYSPSSTAASSNADEDRPGAVVLSGPVGIGKTALVYAAAQELGMRVVEVNAGNKAKGSTIEALVGEAMQSSAVQSQQVVSHGRGNRGSSADDSLILLDDLDKQVELDPSLMAPLTKLIASSKRPVVVTCNDETHLSLSAQVDILRLEMQRPSTQDLLEHLVLVSVCENVCTSLAWLSNILRLCCGDLRKALLMVQLWSKGMPTPSSTPGVQVHVASDWTLLMWHVAQRISNLMGTLPQPESSRQSEQARSGQDGDRQVGTSVQCGPRSAGNQPQAACQRLCECLSALDSCAQAMPGCDNDDGPPVWPNQARPDLSCPDPQAHANVLEAQAVFDVASQQAGCCGMHPAPEGHSQASYMAACREDTSASLDRQSWLRQMAKTAPSVLPAGSRQCYSVYRMPRPAAQHQELEQDQQQHHHPVCNTLGLPADTAYALNLLQLKSLPLVCNAE
ncbi:hypothetical protein ABBQ38_012871 [Trebouxia sp. C0009 RCD-2024]